MKKIKWGVIGTAGIARSCTIPGMIQAYNCELYAIAGRSIDKAEQFKEKFGFEKAYGSYKELLDDPEVEAVYIALKKNYLTRQKRTMYILWKLLHISTVHISLQLRKR